MFGRKDNEETEDNTMTQQDAASALQSPATAAPRSDAPRPASPLATRRPLDTGRRPASPAPRMGGETEERKLIVGKGLSLSGEITACDVLVVEGKVEAKLADGKMLEITETGQFRGNVEIENADIAGRYDGELTVHGRLTVRGTGRISGIVKYGELEVNAGGQIIGEMHVVGGGAQQGEQPRSSAFKSAAGKTSSKFSSVGHEGHEMENEEDPGALFARKTATGA